MRGGAKLYTRLSFTIFVASVWAITLWSVYKVRTALPGAQFDLHWCPVALAIGLLIGWPVGKLRVKVLRKIGSPSEGKYFMSDLISTSHLPEGRRAEIIGFAALLVPVALWIGVIPFASKGTFVYPVAITASYVLGIHLTGSFLPFARVWRESKCAEVLPLSGDVSSPPIEAPSEMVPGERIRLRWAFSPRLQMVWGIIVTGVIGAAALLLAHVDPARIDPYLSPVGLAIGLYVGYPLGVRRLRVLRGLLRSLDGRFFFAQWDAMVSTPEGAAVMKLQGLFWAIALIGTFGISALSNGKISVGGTCLFFGLGAFLTGKIWPFVRLRRELKNNASATR